VVATKGNIEKIDGPLMVRVASLSRGSQRWLKTMLQSMAAAEGMPALEAEEMPALEEEVEPRPRAKGKTETSPEAPPNRATLEDVVTGKVDLRDQLESYPELSEELDGMADVIDLLREAGARRRRKGEQILREEILGEAPEGEEEQETSD
jgi:hypothetical protein